MYELVANALGWWKCKPAKLAMWKAQSNQEELRK